MARRKTVNKTGIARVEGIPYHDAWVAYKCVSCREMNYINIGQKLLTPTEAVDNEVWKCEHCGFIHSKESDLPKRIKEIKKILLVYELVPNLTDENKKLLGFDFLS